MNLDFMIPLLKKEIPIKKITGTSRKIITGLAYDSRDVEKGFAFFALKGLHTDGHKYISRAEDLGASVIFHSDNLPEYRKDVTYIHVPDTRIIMAPVSALFYNYPAKKMTLIGVTGTDGKSTTVSFIHQLLTFAGIKAGFISTVQYDTGTGAVKNHYRQSTPEATEIHKILNQMTENGCTHAVIEATSHGLSPVNNRLGSIHFDAGVLTNISHEHLEFHKTLQRYVNDKANLFRAIKKETGIGIINSDEPFASSFEKNCRGKVFTYSITQKNTDLSATNIRGTEEKEYFTLMSNEKSYETFIPLPGTFNIENTLAALLTVSKILNREYSTLVPFLSRLKPVTGRMNFIHCGQNFSVLVDYAHTPGAFKKLFPLLKKGETNRLIAVFGSAGERDTEKRKVQGEIADTYADIIVLTDEDPRGEDSLKIMEEIAEGCVRKEKGNDLFLIPDRKEAIQFALKLAGEKDLVILLGKGHESSILYKEKKIPWNEAETVIKSLHELGWTEDI